MNSSQPVDFDEVNKKTKVIQLTLAEKKTDKRIKVRMYERDKKLMTDILKDYFRITHTMEVKK